MEAGLIGEPIRLRFSLGWKEYAAAERELQRVGNPAPNSIITAVVFLSAGVASYALRGPEWLTVVLLVGASMNFALPVFRAFGIRMRWRREQLLRAEHRVDFSDDGIHYELGGIESDLSWNYFQRWLETSQAFLLIYGGDVFSLFPKQAVNSVCTTETFRDFLSARLPQFSTPRN